MTVDEVMRWIRAERRRQMRAFLDAVRDKRLSSSSEIVKQGCGYDPAAFRAWLEEAAE